MSEELLKCKYCDQIPIMKGSADKSGSLFFLILSCDCSVNFPKREGLDNCHFLNEHAAIHNWNELNKPTAGGLAEDGENK